jgi:hypothetical protein
VQASPEQVGRSGRLPSLCSGCAPQGAARLTDVLLLELSSQVTLDEGRLAHTTITHQHQLANAGNAQAVCLLGLAVLGLKAGGNGCAGRAMRRGRLERRDHSHLCRGADGESNTADSRRAALAPFAGAWGKGRPKSPERAGDQEERPLLLKSRTAPRRTRGP